MISLASPDTFVDAVPHAALAALRATSPVVWQEMDGEPGFWAVLGHAEVVRVSTHPTLFSASDGGESFARLSVADLSILVSGGSALGTEISSNPPLLICGLPGNGF